MQTNSRTYRFLAVTMAFIMLSTSVSFAVDLHFCQGKLKSVSLLGEAKTCHEKQDKVMVACPKHGTMMVDAATCGSDKNGCCQNKSLQIESNQDEVLPVSNKIAQVQLQNFALAYAATFYSYPSTSVTPDYQEYKPPLILRDIPVLIQCFLN